MSAFLACENDFYQAEFSYFEGEYTEKMPQGYIGRSIYKLDGRGWTIDGSGSYNTAKQAIQALWTQDRHDELLRNDY